jgi:hypothetical protein
MTCLQMEGQHNVSERRMVEECMLAGGSCEHGRETKGRREYFAYLSNWQLLKGCSLFSIMTPETN